MSGWDAVYDDLLTFVPTLTGLSASLVFDGPPLTTVTPPLFAVIGDNGDGDGGFFNQSEPQSDTFVVEEGELRCLFVAQSGDEGSLSTLRASMNGWLNGLRAHFHGDSTLGGALRPGSTVSVGRVEPSQRQNKQGAVVMAVVTVAYTTRL